jgi:hypothetical protein
MPFSVLQISLRLSLTAVVSVAILASAEAAAQCPSWSFAQGLQPHNVTVDCLNYRGRRAVRVRSLPSADFVYDAQKSGTGGGIVLLQGHSFHDGTIDVDVAGEPQANAPALARGFVGIAFRVPLDASRYDYVYIRPTNGRANDQERRNHSTQYASFPDNGWLTLRAESPGKYESYTDLIPEEWTHLKIEVNGVRMRLYVNGAAQPTLIVNDLKLGDSEGAIALWIGIGTEANFTHLRISRFAVVRSSCVPAGPGHESPRAWHR